MKKLLTLGLLAVMATVLTGCGVKGALYIPKDKPQQQQELNKL